MSDSKLYVLKNLEKKNAYNTEFWVNDDGRSFQIEEMFRWGETVLVLTDEEAQEIRDDIAEGHPICATDYQIEDNNLDDGCSLYFQECNDITVEQVEELWDNDMYSAFEEAGFVFEDVELIYYGPCELVECKSE